MKIISKFHDYYDTASAHGVSDVYYQRTESKQQYSGPLGELLHRMRYWHTTQYFTPAFILFCGKVFPMVRIDPGNPYVYPRPDAFYLTCLEDWGRYEQKQRDERALDKWAIWNEWPKARFQREGFIPCTKEGWQEILTLCERFDSTEVLRSVQAPIALLETNYRGDTYHLSINPQLKGFGFQKVRGPFEAYQEIDSFISGVLGTSGRPVAETSSIHRLEAHGFDKVTSFRNMKR